MPWLEDPTQNNVSPPNNEIPSHIEYDKSNLREAFPISKDNEMDCGSELGKINVYYLYINLIRYTFQKPITCI